MPNETRSLYEILRVPTNAQADQIERAYRRVKAELQKETTPPDPRLRALIEHAHDVLMDPVRREQYDRRWFAPKAQIVRARRNPAAIAAATAAVAAVATAGWMALRPRDAPPARAGRPVAEVQSAASMAVGRVVRIDANGSPTRLGLAFAIAEGTLVTACEGLAPDSVVVVQFGKRSVPTHPSGIDAATGLCKLTGEGVGSWPLPLASARPRAGERVFAVRIAPGAEPQLVDEEFRRNVALGDVAGLQASQAPDPHDLGGPLLDVDGHVLGAASRVGGLSMYIPVPRSWLPEPPAGEHSPPVPRPAETAPAEPPSGPGPNISPERRERLEKAFHPPPNVPDNI